MNYDTNDFQKDVIEKSYSIPVVVDFWAEWCGPCKVLGPILEKFAEKSSDWKLVKLNTDLFPDIAVELEIRGIPAVKLFINGEIVDEFTGALPEHMVEKWLKKAIPAKKDEHFETAISLIEMNKSEEAEKLLKDILKRDPQNEDAKILLAKSILFTNPAEASNLIQSLESTSNNGDTIIAVQNISDLLKRKEELKSLPESKIKEAYISAVYEMSKKQFDTALTKFINIIREDRSFDDDGARKACIGIFKYLGEDNELTIKHRRDFGSALYI